VTRKIARYGWIPDLPDQRDHLFAAQPDTLTKLPPSVDLRPGCPEVYDQGQLGSCTGNAIAAAIQFDEMKQNETNPAPPSRLFIYFNERSIEGTIQSDAGAQIRDGIKSVNQTGYCREDLWPYDIAQFAAKPPQPAYDDAAGHKAVQYQRLSHDLQQMKGSLAEGYPFVFGFTVYESFEGPEVAKSGNCPMPGSTEKSIGGHAVLAVGYDDANQWFWVRNSWGSDWGQGGYFTLPYAYIAQRNLSSDFWNIRLVA